MAKILVVDDSETTRTEMRRALEGSGHEIIEAEDGISGLEQIAKYPDIKMLLCDINMPRMDGMTMLRKVREIPEFKNTAALMLTTESSAEMKQIAKELGVIAWITKPLVPARVLSVIEKILARPA